MLSRCVNSQSRHMPVRHERLREFRKAASRAARSQPPATPQTHRYKDCATFCTRNEPDTIGKYRGFVAGASPSNTCCAKTASPHRHVHENYVWSGKQTSNEHQPTAEEIGRAPAGSQCATGACFSVTRHPGELHTECVWDERDRKEYAGCA